MKVYSYVHACIDRCGQVLCRYVAVLMLSNISIATTAELTTVNTTLSPIFSIDVLSAACVQEALQATILNTYGKPCAPQHGQSRLSRESSICRTPVYSLSY